MGMGLVRRGAARTMTCSSHTRSHHEVGGRQRRPWPMRPRRERGTESQGGDAGSAGSEGRASTAYRVVSTR